TSTTAPLPSSPHCVPMTTTFRPTLPSHAEEKHQASDHGRETEQAQAAFLERRERGEAASPVLRRQKGEKPLEHQVKSQTRKKIRPGQSPKPPSNQFEKSSGSVRADLILQELEELAIGLQHEHVLILADRFAVRLHAAIERVELAVLRVRRGVDLRRTRVARAAEALRVAV